MNEPVEQDTLTHRATIDQLPLDQAERMLEDLRARRMVLFRKFSELQALSSRARADAAQAALSKRLIMVAKKLAVADKAIEAVSDQINKARALAVQIEDEHINEQQFADRSHLREDKPGGSE